MRPRALPVAPFLLAVLATAGCLGDNPVTGDYQAFIDSLPDKGRTSIDKHTQAGVLGLTFDDGPSEFTHDIIDVLARHHVEATFFVVGRNIPGRRDVLEYARLNNQQIGNHSYNHEPQPTLTEAQFKFRLQAVKTNINSADRGRLYFRFPYGAAGDEQLRWLHDVDIDGRTYRPVGWHSDTQDFDFDEGYPDNPFSKNILDDSKGCGGQANPFQRDLIGWTQFIARKTKGGVLLFHDTRRITHDKLDEILTGFESPEKYWATAPPATKDEYLRYYTCDKVDPNLRLQLQPLWGGAWPSLKD
jgi:peptidoglycan/xylan/chitin deacetylase (PgdA/CDA1 family)